jgi:hypothetical protein
MSSPPVEYAALSDAQLRRLDVDTNGLSPAGAELRRRSLGAKLGGADPWAALDQLEAMRTPPDYRTPSERLVWLESRRFLSAHGVDPHLLVMQMHALRITEGW